MSEYKCANCEFCGKEVDADLMCTLTLNNEQKVETSCWCICKECEEKFKTKVKDVYDCLIEDVKKAE